MPSSSNDIIFQIIAITAVFLIVAFFLLLFINSYNLRKKRHLQEKKDMEQVFEQELMKTRMEVQEQTLQTIATDIHDNVGQLLSLTRISLSTINISDQPVKAKEKINGALGLLDTSIKELRQLAAVLHAENLLTAGLHVAIEREVDRLSKAGDFETVLTVSGDIRRIPDHQKELIVFRVVQELLNNTIKHANATKIEIEMAYSDEKLRVSVIDNGRGFDLADALRSNTGIGLNNLLKRAQMIGGELVVNTGVGSGTKATIVIPINTPG